MSPADDKVCYTSQLIPLDTEAAGVVVPAGQGPVQLGHTLGSSKLGVLSKTQSNQCYWALEKHLLAKVDFLSDSIMSLKRQI